jgi:endonuclease YncB( thermonuclease family)
MINSQKRRQFILALFLCLLFTAPAFSAVITSSVLQPLCLGQGSLQRAFVSRVVDGDTLILEGSKGAKDKRIRLVGVNTPELDHKDGNHQPFAWQAYQFLKSYENTFIYYQEGPDKRDRYGRYLYYLFDIDRISIGSQLISQGLGYRIAIPPNIKYQSCLIKAETQAKDLSLGVWSKTQQWLPQVGFVVANVIIKSVTRNRGGWWLKTKQGLVINLPKSYADQWSEQAVFQLEEQRLQVRGWQYFRTSKKAEHKSWILLIKHPNDLVPVPQ